MSDWQLHLGSVLLIGYLAWKIASRPYSSSAAYQTIHLGTANFSVLFSAAMFLYLFLLQVVRIPLPDWLLDATLLAWGFAAATLAYLASTLYESPPLRWPLRACALALVPLATAAKVLGKSGFSGVLGQANQVLGHELALTKIDVPGILIALFLFVALFGALSYYGRVYRVYLDEKHLRQQDNLFEAESLDVSITIACAGLALVVTLILVGADFSSVAILIGLIVAGLTVSLSDLINNMIAGLVLMWDKPIKKDEIVSVGEVSYGKVMSIRLRYTTLEDRNKVQFMIPNSEVVKTTIANSSRRQFVRLKLDIEVAYGTNLELARELMIQAAMENPRVLKTQPVTVLIIACAESGIRLQLRFHIFDPEEGIRNVMSAIYWKIIPKFREKGIALPFPQREIRILQRVPKTMQKSQRQADGDGEENGTDLEPLFVAVPNPTSGETAPP
jgi:small-conductance mechanosensitive channel